VTCRRKYCLIDICTYDAETDTDPYTEPTNFDEPAEPQYQQYRPNDPNGPPTVASQVECIADNTFMYLSVLALISYAIMLSRFNNPVTEISTIVFGVGAGISLVVAAAEQLVDRQKATATEPPLDELR
jgi:hypothetical protein